MARWRAIEITVMNRLRISRCRPRESGDPVNTDLAICAPASQHLPLESWVPACAGRRHLSKPSPPQHHESVERDGAFARWQRDERIDVDAFQFVAEVVGEPPERQQRRKHAGL